LIWLLHPINDRHAMTFPNSCLFNKTAAQCRRVGARGGRARARNLRLCRPTTQPPPAPPEHEPETAHEASVLLNERFPHLSVAFGPRQTKRAAIIELLRRDCGATLDDIVQATGWTRPQTNSNFRSAVGRGIVIAPVFRSDGTKAYAAR